MYAIDPTAKTSAPLTIGQLAKAAGVNVETIRYYQRIGLLAEPPRPAQGYRRYPATALTRLRFIKRAQEVGFSLQDIGDLLALDAADCHQAQAIAEQKNRLVRQRIEKLRSIERELRQLIAACREPGMDGEDCALMSALGRPRRD